MCAMNLVCETFTWVDARRIRALRVGNNAIVWRTNRIPRYMYEEWIIKEKSDSRIALHKHTRARFSPSRTLSHSIILSLYLSAAIPQSSCLSLFTCTPFYLILFNFFGWKHFSVSFIFNYILSVFITYYLFVFSFGVFYFILASLSPSAYFSFLTVSLLILKDRETKEVKWRVL